MQYIRWILSYAATLMSLLLCRLFYHYFISPYYKIFSIVTTPYIHDTLLLAIVIYYYYYIITPHYANFIRHDIKATFAVYVYYYDTYYRGASLLLPLHIITLYHLVTPLALLATIAIIGHYRSSLYALLLSLHWFITPPQIGHYYHYAIICRH